MEYKQVAVVVLGSFNPAIFHPLWFKNNEILPEIETRAAEDAKDIVVTHQVSVLKFRSLNLEVFGNRWSLTTERIDWFKDIGPIVASIFDRLPHTPVTGLGLSFITHVPTNVTPEKAISLWSTSTGFTSVLGKDPKMGLIGRATWEEYSLLLNFEPSLHVPGGVFVGQNYERKVKDASEIKTILAAKSWEKLLAREECVSETLLKGPAQS